MFQRLTGKLTKRSSNFESTTVRINNPAYNEDEIDDFDPENLRRQSVASNASSGSQFYDEYDDSDDLFDMEDIVDALDELEVVKKSETLDIHTLNRNKIGNITLWRDGPAPIGDNSSYEVIKLGSLEGNKTNPNNAILTTYNISRITEENRNEEATVALINYFSELGKSRNNAQIDYVFVEQLLLSADVNAQDVHGQTIMHEVAREWNVDVAIYLKTRGMNIDIPDKWGRTPLFVAVSSNYTEMVSWLVRNGANIEKETIKDELRKPIHFAAIHDAVESFDLLVSHGADPNSMDGMAQTPLFLAAQYAQVRIVHHMLELNLPVATANNDGVMCLELIISNLPTETAWRALDKYMVTDKVNRKKKFYINRLGKKGALNKTNYTARQFQSPDVLELIVDSGDLMLVTHPVILQLIRLKSKSFAYKYRIMNIILYLIFTVLWSASISIYDTNTRGWTYNVSLIVVLTILAFLMTVHFLYKIYSEYQICLRQNKMEKERSRRSMHLRAKYLHPRWISEQVLFDKEAESLNRKTISYWQSGWNILEAICLCMATVQFLITMVWIGKPNTPRISEIRTFFSAVFIVIVWLRLNNCFHSSQQVGGFVAMLGECVIAVARFGFLFCEFFIPFTCAFWVLFGGKRKVLETYDSEGEYKQFNNLVYQMYLLTLVGDYNYTDLNNIDKVTSQILVGLYFLLVSVVTINLFIALMSEAISRVNQTASATAYLREALEINLLERHFPQHSCAFEKYITDECCPYELTYERLSNDNITENLDKAILTARKLTEEMQTSIRTIKEASKSMEQLMEAIQSFNAKYPYATSDKYLEAMTKSTEFYGKFVNKLQRKVMYMMDKKSEEEKFLEI